MEERTQQLQDAKQACRAEKRKTVTLWKWITAGCLLAAFVLMPVSMALGGCADTLAVLRAPKDPQVVYYPSAYTSPEAYEQAGEELFARLTQESAVLVKNDGALPFAKGMQLTCLADETQQAQMLADMLQQRSAGGVEIAVAICGGGELTQQQKTLLQQSGEKGIKTVLVLLGAEGSSLLAEPVDGCLWLPYGQAPATAEALLWGQTVPSGRLPLTIGAATPDNGGIYTDYRFYETAYEDAVSGVLADFDYDQQVLYPFGHGLSYTSFACGDMVTQEKADGFEVSIKVTNTGSRAGKQVVQLYGQSPYTQYDQQNQVEKPAVFLAGFGKTQLLQPGQSQTVCVFVDKQQFASYDANGAGTYILEAGDYYLCVAGNAHDGLNRILAAKSMAAEATEAGSKEQVFVWNCPETRTDLCVGQTNLYETTAQQGSISRQNWVEVTEQPAPALCSDGTEETKQPAVTGAQNGIALWQIAGLDWDDPYWQTLLDQLELEELEQLSGNSSRFVKPAHQDGILPDGKTLAASFDESLARQMGAWAAEQWLDRGFVYESRLGETVGDNYLLGRLLCAQAEGLKQAGVQVIAQSGQHAFTTEQAMRETEQKALQILLQKGVGLQTEQQAILALAQQWDVRGMTLTEGESYATDLRQAAKRTLYAMAHSSFMNGIGPETKTIAQTLQLQRVTLTLALACVPVAAASGLLWLRGWRKLRLTQAYLDYKTLKKTIREEKKNKETAPQ